MAYVERCQIKIDYVASELFKTRNVFSQKQSCKWCSEPLLVHEMLLMKCTYHMWICYLFVLTKCRILLYSVNKIKNKVEM